MHGSTEYPGLEDTNDYDDRGPGSGKGSSGDYCYMPADEIRSTVTRNADGFMPSSKEFRVTAEVEGKSEILGCLIKYHRSIFYAKFSVLRVVAKKMP
ncbi:unnamed protein product [Dibothriocephalus latus]|uniref:Uncharacterized protein n=1 Tax=Dibothriocephalus latus TaxID=60516 RepID=A0A3P6QRG6_DIBLA|nr:unnamed protein product [Dibothriocephalus latus]